MREKTQDLLAVAGIGWGAVIIIIAFVIGYHHCQNHEAKVLECVKAGHNPIECGNAFKSKP